MHPTLYELPNLPGGGLHSWGLMVMLGFLGAFVISGIRARVVGIDPDKLVPLYMLSCVWIGGFTTPTFPIQRGTTRVLR